MIWFITSNFHDYLELIRIKAKAESFSDAEGGNCANR